MPAKKHRLFIIAGLKGAGKTTASKTLLPDILGIREFVNADEIAAGLSPFNPESVAIEAGRLMLKRIDSLLQQRIDFAFETTLASRSFVSTIVKAQHLNYKVSVFYFWLNSPQLATDRVAQRVQKGGHNIPQDVIQRRYFAGI